MDYKELLKKFMLLIGAETPFFIDRGEPWSDPDTGRLTSEELKELRLLWSQVEKQIDK